MSKIPQEAIEALDWANFDEIKLNREWLPDDQELIYTAINAYNGEGDMDDDCLEQIIERLLLAWRRADAARAQGAEVEPVAWQWRWKNNSCPWDQGRVPNWVKEAGDVVEERALYTTPPAPQPTEREKVLEEAIREAIDLLMCRKLGSHARSPEHNARLKLQTALAGKAPSQTDRAEGGDAT